MTDFKDRETSGAVPVKRGAGPERFGPERFGPGTLGRAGKRRRILGPGILIVWVTASLAWTAYVATDFYHRACDQADMSAEIDHDLDAAACAGPNCPGAGPPAPQEDWTKVASTYLHFGYVSIMEWAMLPPLGLLLIFVGSSAIHRRRSGQHSVKS